MSVLKNSTQVFQNHNYYPEPFNKCVWDRPVLAQSNKGEEDVIKQEVFRLDSPMQKNFPWSERPKASPEQKAAILSVHSNTQIYKKSNFGKFFKFSKKHDIGTIIFYIDKCQGIKRTRTQLVQILENAKPKLGQFYYKGYYYHTVTYEIFAAVESTQLSVGGSTKFSVAEFVGVRW